MTLVAGVDSSTQSCKVVVRDAGTGALVREGRLPDGDPVPAGGWLAAILSAFLIGASLDLGTFFVWLGQYGVRGAAGTTGAAALTALWGVLVGWIPALVTLRMRGATDVGAAGAPAAETSRSRRPRVSAALVAAGVIAGVGALALPVAAQSGHAALQEVVLQEQAAAEPPADPDGAAPIDPDAVGESVPSIASSSAPETAGMCTAENTTILAPPADAATGHRAQSLQLVNTSDTACVVDGYPDLAYGDQNGHVLDVTIEQGSSFMAQDPGAQPITLHPGDAAFAVVGWDANSVQGQLAARSLWVGVHPGATRLVWDVTLDIVPGATVQVTAWRGRDLPAE